MKKLTLTFDQLDICKGALPQKDKSVQEIEVSRIVEYLTAEERIILFNELHRILKKGGKLTLVTPDRKSTRLNSSHT